MERDKINYGLLVTIFITVAGWALNFGICKNKIEQNADNITRIEVKLDNEVEKLNNRQASTDTLLQSINTQLVELNTKMTLLLNGKITAAE